MPLRSPKMNRFIFGFQRRVWCPKWTPASSIWRMVTTAMMGTPPLRLAAPRSWRRGDRRRSETLMSGPSGLTAGWTCYRRAGTLAHLATRDACDTRMVGGGAGRGAEPSMGTSRGRYRSDAEERGRDRCSGRPRGARSRTGRSSCRRRRPAAPLSPTATPSDASRPYVAERPSAGRPPRSARRRRPAERRRRPAAAATHRRSGVRLVLQASIARAVRARRRAERVDDRRRATGGW